LVASPDTYLSAAEAAETKPIDSYVEATVFDGNTAAAAEVEQNAKAVGQMVEVRV